MIALLLAMLLGLAIAQRESTGRAMVVFLVICTALTIIVGLRWTVSKTIFAATYADKAGQAGLAATRS